LAEWSQGAEIGRRTVPMLSAEEDVEESNRRIKEACGRGEAIPLEMGSMTWTQRSRTQVPQPNQPTRGSTDLSLSLLSFPKGDEKGGGGDGREA
jgi:hypothetical protein